MNTLLKIFKLIHFKIGILSGIEIYLKIKVIKALEIKNKTE